MLEDTDDYHSASKLVSNHSWIKKHGLKNYEVLYLRCASFYCSFSNFAKVSQGKKHFNSLPLSSVLSPLTMYQTPEDTASARVSHIKLKAKFILGLFPAFFSEAFFDLV